jgi:hypothetical protein
MKHVSRADAGGDADGLDRLYDADIGREFGLEVHQSLVKISSWITFQPTGLLAWLQGRFGMRTTWLWLRGLTRRFVGA